ncbi:MAG: response regulator [Desulfomicrobiaceae bacterium]|nr:response regulator [Desulfomicrobiaceae bacterium]
MKMRRGWWSIAGVGLVLAALVWAQWAAYTAERAAAQQVAWAQVEAGLAHMEAAVRRLDAEVAVLEDAAQRSALRLQVRMALDDALSELLQGIHRVRVAAVPVLGEEAVQPVLSKAQELEDVCRLVISLKEGASAEDWRHQAGRMRDAWEGLVIAMGQVRRGKAGTQGPEATRWPSFVLAAMGLLLLVWELWRLRGAAMSSAGATRSRGDDSLLDTLPVPVVLVDAAGMVRRVNPAAATLLGIDPAADPGYPWSVLEGGGSALDLGSLLTREVRLLRSDGTAVWVMRMVAPFGVGGEQYWLVVLWDISRRRDVEQTLRAEVERWRGIVESLECGLLAVDGSRQVVAANAAWARLLGRAPAEVAGMSVRKAAPWLRDPDAGVWVGECSGAWVLGRVAPWPQGGDGARVLAAMDATAAYTRGMDAGRRLVLERCLGILARIQAEVARLGEAEISLRCLVQTLQALVELRLGWRPLVASEVVLRPFLQRFFEQARAHGERWGVSVHVGQGRLPERCRVDAAMLRQAMEQLFWGVCMRARGGRLLISVEEVPCDDPQKVLLVFGVQASVEPPSIPSALDMVLGDEFLDGEALHLVVAQLTLRRLGSRGIARHQGPLGTELGFSVELEMLHPPQEVEEPLPEPSPEAPWHAEALPPTPSPVSKFAPAASGFRVVIAEDNPFNAALLESLLVRLGARRTKIVEDGGQLVEAVLQDPAGFDLAVVDVEMPGLSGPEAVERLRAQDVGLPVVAITAHDDAAMEQACLEAGISAVLAKPYDVSQLAAVLRRLGFMVNDG